VEHPVAPRSTKQVLFAAVPSKVVLLSAVFKQVEPASHALPASQPVAPLAI